MNIKVGDRFSRLVVLRQSDKWRYWICSCDCGKTTEVREDHLLSGGTRSCGCIRIGHPSYNKLPPGEAWFNRVYREARIKALQRHLIWNLTKDQVRLVICQPCYYCGREPSHLGVASSKPFYGAMPYNGLDRIDNSLGYLIDNIVPCCKYCNHAKSDMTQEEFFDLIEKIYKRRKR